MKKSNDTLGESFEPWLEGAKRISARQARNLPHGARLELHYKCAGGLHRVLCGSVELLQGGYKVFTYKDGWATAAERLPISEYPGKVWAIREGGVSE